MKDEELELLNLALRLMDFESWLDAALREQRFTKEAEDRIRLRIAALQHRLDALRLVRSMFVNGEFGTGSDFAPEPSGQIGKDD